MTTMASTATHSAHTTDYDQTIKALRAQTNEMVKALKAAAKNAMTGVKTGGVRKPAPKPAELCAGCGVAQGDAKGPWHPKKHRCDSCYRSGRRFVKTSNANRQALLEKIIEESTFDGDTACYENDPSLHIMYDVSAALGSCLVCLVCLV